MLCHPWPTSAVPEVGPAPGWVPRVPCVQGVAPAAGKPRVRLWGCLVLTRGKQGNLGHCPILQWLWGAGRGLCVTPRAGSVLLARLAVLQHPQLCLELQCGAPSFPAGAGFGWSCMPWHAAELCSSARVRDRAVPPGEGQREEKDPLGWVPSELWLQ